MMVSETRIRNLFKREKNILYSRNGGVSDPDGINDIFLYLAQKFQIPVRQVKDIVNPGGYFGGWE